MCASSSKHGYVFHTFFSACQVAGSGLSDEYTQCLLLRNHHPSKGSVENTVCSFTFMSRRPLAFIRTTCLEEKWMHQQVFEYTLKSRKRKLQGKHSLWPPDDVEELGSLPRRNSL